jgi:hypothetical protein
MTKIPCENCLCISVCRNNPLGDVLNRCSNIRSFLNTRDKPKEMEDRILESIQFLRPYWIPPKGD